MSKEAMKLALEALEHLQPTALTSFYTIGNRDKAIAALREALANEALDKKAENARELGLDYEPAQQEPVAYLCENAVGHKYFRWKKPSSTYKPIALYTSPQAQRTWVGLTDEEIEQMGLSNYIKVVRETEAKLKEKNT